jgi:tRNA(fMet)-specific endonuclease VapC
VKFALDTNIAIAALNGIQGVERRLDAIAPDDIVLPAPVVAELMFGAKTSARVDENVAKVERLASAFKTSGFGTEAARRFGDAKAALRRVGFTAQDFDLAIACIALVEDATLVTNDGGLKEAQIDGLRVEDWLGDEGES